MAIPLHFMFDVLSWLVILGLTAILLLQRSRHLERRIHFQSMHASLQETERTIKALQGNVAKIESEKEELAQIFLFLPELISKFTSYLDKREILDITIEGLERLLNPKRSYVFMEKEEGWAAIVKRDPDHPMTEPRCGRKEGILGVACELRMAIDREDIPQLNIEKQTLILQDPLRHLEIQVCAPLVYEEEILGLLALSGIPRYSRQKKVLVSMISNLAAGAIMSSKLFGRYRHMASKDPLTDLSNKRAFERALLDAILKGSREKRPFSVFLFDIDHFKNYNDTNGHQAGDEALRIMANLIREGFRNVDVKARYGGEEFIILLNDTTTEQALLLAEKFRIKVEGFPFPYGKNQPGGRLTISGGVAQFPVDGGNSREIVERADEALYEAKKEGRNRILPARSLDFSVDEAVKKRWVQVTKIREKQGGNLKVGAVIKGWERGPLEVGKPYSIVQENGRSIRFSPTLRMDGDTFETERSIYRLHVVTDAMGSGRTHPLHEGPFSTEGRR